MQRSHIFVPLSGTALSERAIPIAVALADRWRLPLRLVSCVQDDHEVGDQLRYLEEVSRGIRVDHPLRLVDDKVIVEPRTTVAIVEQWSSWALLVMATAGHIYERDHYVGSAAETIVRKSGRPVLLVGPECVVDAGFSPVRVVISVDGSATSEAAIELGLDWAAQLDVEPWFVTVMDPEAEATLAERGVGGGAGMASAYVRHLVREHATEGLAIQWEVLHSADPADAIVTTFGADSLIVVSTHGRSGLSRMALGSVAADICGRAKLPVLVVRPGVEADA